jgi:hypothetical protein
VEAHQTRRIAILPWQNARHGSSPARGFLTILRDAKRAGINALTAASSVMIRGLCGSHTAELLDATDMYEVDCLGCCCPENRLLTSSARSGVMPILSALDSMTLL